jgi:hypothetical protein
MTGNDWAFVRDSHGEIIATARADHARKFAAAEDMLSALKCVAKSYREDATTVLKHSAIDAVEGAIAKANGA